MNWQLLWLWVSVNAAADVTPGPAVMFVLTTALRHGAKRALAAIAGILSANSFYFAVSATALGALLATSKLFPYIKWLGAAYLVYLGLRAWLTKPATDTALETVRGSAARVYRDAFLTQISNPKAVVYFAAIVPRFVDPAQPIPPQMLILGAISICLEFCILSGYATAAGQGLKAAREPRFAVWTNRISGALLMIVGLGLALTPE